MINRIFFDIEMTFIIVRLFLSYHFKFICIYLATNNNIPLRPPPTSSSSSTTSSSSNQPIGSTINPHSSTLKSTNNIRKDKTTRMRTVLNEKQLLTLRTCYGANPRPDAHMKETLVDMTQLSPRVIRVWFQNKRTIIVF
jgi:hypothetical protein